MSLRRIEDHRYDSPLPPPVRPEIDRLPSSREKGSEEVRRLTPLLPFLPLYLLPSLFILTIGGRALRRETADSTVSPSPFTSTILIFGVSEPPRGFFDDRRRTRRAVGAFFVPRGNYRSRRRVEMNTLVCARRLILKYRFPNNYARSRRLTGSPYSASAPRRYSGMKKKKKR